MNSDSIDKGSARSSIQDHFALDHLQSVKAESGWWYYNNRFLGKGGNGTAFLVTASSGPYFGLQLVLKVFHHISRPERRQAFLNEIRHLRQLNHPAGLAHKTPSAQIMGGLHKKGGDARGSAAYNGRKATKGARCEPLSFSRGRWAVFTCYRGSEPGAASRSRHRPSRPGNTTTGS